MFTDILFRLRAILRRRAVEQELDEELRSHLEHEVSQLTAAGLSCREAERRARVAIGGLDQVKEQCRDARGTRLLEDVLQDLRYSWRTLLKSRSFTVAAVTSVALGIGSTTAVFTLIHAAILRPLPVTEPDRLIELLTDRGDGRPGNAFSYQALVHFRDHATTIDGVIASHNSRLFVAIDGAAPEMAGGQYVAGNFFSVLGVGAQLGRTIRPTDDQPDAAPIAVLGHHYWRQRFGADPRVLGRTVTINDVPFTIAGVAAPEFHGMVAGRHVQLWVPLATEPLMRTPSWTSSPGYKWLQLVVRVKPGTSYDQARAELSTMFTTGVIQAEVAMLRQRSPVAKPPQWTLATAPAGSGLSMVRQQYGEPLFVLFAVSGAVLLIACVNVANLLLARANVRRPEIALRLSLGAGRSRILRQLLTESMLLAFLGAALGIGFAYIGCLYVLGFSGTGRDQLSLDVVPDLQVLAFAAASTIATGLLFGVAPAWRTAGHAPGASLLGRVKGGRDRRVLSRVLIAGQVALSVTMLLCAGLFLRSLQNLKSIDTGFDSDSVLVISTDQSRSRLNAEARRAAFREAVTRISALPGVQAATLADVTPIEGGGTMLTLSVKAADGTVHEVRNLHMVWVGPNYFSTMKMPIHAGRDFGWQDSVNGTKVAIINRTMARQLFGNDNGFRGATIGKAAAAYEIIGVAGDAKYLQLRQDVPPTMYLHGFQPDEIIPGQFAIRTAGDPRRIADLVREHIRIVAPSVPITSVRTLTEQLDASIVRERLLAVLSGFFAAVGLLLAAVGLYGVMAYSVSQRTSEIGIRMALGAKPLQICDMVIREALVLIAIGLTLGLVGGLLLSRTLATFLFGLTPRDPQTLWAVVILMLITGLAAAFLPARRAARIQPTTALRME
jgi:predicted permease